MKIGKSDAENDAFQYGIRRNLEFKNSNFCQITVTI